MTIASEISRLQCAKNEIKTAIADKWVSIWSNVKLDDYCSCIKNIPSMTCDQKCISSMCPWFRCDFWSTNSYSLAFASYDPQTQYHYWVVYAMNWWTIYWYDVFAHHPTKWFMRWCYNGSFDVSYTSNPWVSVVPMSWNGLWIVIWQNSYTNPSCVQIMWYINMDNNTRTHTNQKIAWSYSRTVCSNCRDMWRWYKFVCGRWSWTYWSASYLDVVSTN